MHENITMQPIGYVISPIEVPADIKYECVVSKIMLLPEYHGGLEGLADFSHAFILFYLQQAEYEPEHHLQRRPRGLASLPLMGIFARRAKERPNRIGLTVVKVLRVDNDEIEVQGLDAMHGTPVLDIKPYFPYFDSKDDAKVPEWTKV